MQLFDPNNPNEKKKMIAAGVLAVAAIGVLGYVFFGGSSTKTPPSNKIATGPSPTPNRLPKDIDTPDEDSVFQPVAFSGSVPAVSEADRNIFSYYEPTPRPTPPPYIPTPTPVPPPPLTVSSMNPANVYARTADFGLQIMGDKFTPALHITIDGRDMPTRFINAQQLFTTVPATLIANPGSRAVLVQSNDRKLYSATLTLNVATPPPPNYNYIGLIGMKHFNDTAVLQDKSTKDLVNVQRGDLVGGHYRVSSISEKEVIVVDTTLKITHKIGYTVDAAAGPQFRPPVRTSDDEPQ